VDWRKKLVSIFPSNTGPKKFQRRDPFVSELGGEPSARILRPSLRLVITEGKPGASDDLVNELMSSPSLVTRSDDDNVIQISIDPAAGIKSTQFHGQVVKGRSQAQGKEQWGQGATLIDASRGNDGLCNASGIPEHMDSRVSQPRVERGGQCRQARGHAVPYLLPWK